MTTQKDKTKNKKTKTTLEMPFLRKIKRRGDLNKQQEKRTHFPCPCSTSQSTDQRIKQLTEIRLRQRRTLNKQNTLLEDKFTNQRFLQMQ